MAKPVKCKALLVLATLIADTSHYSAHWSSLQSFFGRSLPTASV
jgi:hypothetical protein